MTAIAAAAIAAFGEPNKNLSNSKELRFGNKGSLAVSIAGDDQGCWYSFETGEGGKLRDGVNVDYNSDAVPRTRRDMARPDHADYAEQIIAESVAADTSNPAGKYLQSRSLRLFPLETTRFFQNSFFRACVFIATDPNQYHTAIQLVYIDAKGRKEPYKNVSKRTFAIHPMWSAYGSYWLPSFNCLTPVICEGPETALSIWAAFNGNRNVFCTFGVSNLKKVRTRGSVVKPIIAADGDAENSAAWETVQKAAGRAARVVAAPIGKDFNDVLCEAGPATVRKYFR